MCYCEDMSFRSLPMLGHMKEAQARDYQRNSKPVDTSEDVDALRAARPVHQLVEQQNPQEIDFSQERGIPPKTHDTRTQTRLDAFRAHADASAVHHSRNMPVSKHGGKWHFWEAKLNQKLTMRKCAKSAAHAFQVLYTMNVSACEPSMGMQYILEYHKRRPLPDINNNAICSPILKVKTML